MIKQRVAPCRHEMVCNGMIGLNMSSGTPGQTLAKTPANRALIGTYPIVVSDLYRHAQHKMQIRNKMVVRSFINVWLMLLSLIDAGILSAYVSCPTSIDAPLLTGEPLKGSI